MDGADVEPAQRNLECLEDRHAAETQPTRRQAAIDSGSQLADTECQLAGSKDDEEEEEQNLLDGWNHKPDALSLQEVNGSVKIPAPTAHWFVKLLAFSGLGFIISVGYMDPGNWATDISAGAAFGYDLLVVVLLSNFCAMFLQALSLKLGVVAERDLAQACRDAYPPWLNVTLWILAEIAIAATDLAEVIGSATALNLLFGLPLWAGVLLTSTDTLFVLFFGLHNFRFLEALVFLLCVLVAGSFVYELAKVGPDWSKVMEGFIPKTRLITNSNILYNAIGILGATVMPHNLYLHSSIIQTRAYKRTTEGKKMAVKYGTIDSCISLSMAFFVNAAILTLAAAAFHYGPHANQSVAYISDAYKLIAPALGSNVARVLFGVALLASGQNSTITGTLAGQVVMEGFISLSIPPWARRLVTRLLAILPAGLVAGLAGEAGAGRLLVLSQVILSLQLPFAIIPLVHFTSSRSRMGKFVNGWTTYLSAILVAVVISLLNVYLIFLSFKTNTFGSTSGV